MKRVGHGRCNSHDGVVPLGFRGQSVGENRGVLRGRRPWGNLGAPDFVRQLGKLARVKAAEVRRRLNGI